MSAVRQVPSLELSAWDVYGETITPPSPQAVALLAENERRVARLVAERFGPDSVIAAMLNVPGAA